MFILKRNIKLFYFVFTISLVNFLLFNIPFFKFVLTTLDHSSVSSFTIVISLAFLMLALNAFVFLIILLISEIIGKILLASFFILSSIAIYFINTYGIIIDETMIGNVFNTSYEESSSLFSFGLIRYLFFLGIVPSVLIFKTNLTIESFKKRVLPLPFLLVFILSLTYINSSNWLWVDNHDTKLGALVMPWSYVVNTSRYYNHKKKKDIKEILLPDAIIKDKEKSIMVLVIGEAARRKNFSLYGYEKPTNPLLSKTQNIYHFNANACATYTTAAVKCMLEYKNTNKLYEILPNYLYRNDVAVIWRTTNWGEPPLHIENILMKKELKTRCEGINCDFDEILLSGLKEQILGVSKDKILVVLHTSTSHGPAYNEKYPDRFECFKPVCKSVELEKCTTEELINAYDNTILYTDYILHRLIEELKQIKEYKSAMLYVSDHGQSLGENNLYLHGIPKSIAPKEQLEIPFIVWVSDSSQKLKQNDQFTQHHVFHSVLNFLALDSPIYDKKMSIFK